MAVKILVTNKSLAPEALAMLAAREAETLFLPISTPPEEVRRVAEREAVDAILSRTIRLDAAAIAASPRLRVIAKHGVGYDNIDITAATARGVPVLIAVAANARSVAEHTLMLMLMLARKVVPLDAALRRGAWPRDGYQGAELFGKHLGIVGCGNIGGLLARLALALGLRVSAYDPYVPAERMPEGCAKAERLEDLLPEGDILSLHCPLTAETRDMIDARALARMKRSAFLVNAARGAVVNEVALVAALRAGRIAGAALDSFTEEPAAPDSPLWTLPNTVYTPHIAAITDAASVRVATQCVENIFTILDGKSPDPRALVNPEALRRSSP